MPESINQNPRAFAGSNLLALNRTLLTDAAPDYSAILACGHCNTIVVDLVADKGCSVIIIPVLDVDDDTALGKPSDTGVLPNLGGSERFLYSAIGAPKVKVVISKTESGTCCNASLRCAGRPDVPRQWDTTGHRRRDRQRY